MMMVGVKIEWKAKEEKMWQQQDEGQTYNKNKKNMRQSKAYFNHIPFHPFSSPPKTGPAGNSRRSTEGATTGGSGGAPKREIECDGKTIRTPGMEEGRPASQSFSMHEHADPARLWNRLGEYRDTSNIATPVGDPSAATFSSNNEPDKTGDHQRAAQTTQRRAAPTQQVRTTACTPTAATPAADLGDEGRHKGGATDPSNVRFNGSVMLDHLL